MISYLRKVYINYEKSSTCLEIPLVYEVSHVIRMEYLFYLFEGAK